MGQKPDDWRTVSLCDDCHNFGAGSQHSVGERTFWQGIKYEELIAEFSKASPCRAEIERIQRERGAPA